jgi:hypothetical protein
VPRLVQFGDLTPAHFVESPVWASSHSFDYDEPWYDETDEETFRPWDGPLPVSPHDGLFLVRARFTLADQHSLDGFLTPAIPTGSGERVLGAIQPQLFLESGKRVAFWLGMFGDPTRACANLYSGLGKSANAVFPIRFRAFDDLASGVTQGELLGFYIVPDGSTVDSVR